ncbi:MAG TPA: amidase [Solirubrobacterales bacterium]|jgi:amidase|nr:amidase [Solirubrobacterales bacterium]
MSDEIAFAGAARQAEMVRAGEVSPTELVRLHLDRIERLDPQLNAFRKVFAERALLEAEQAEAWLKGGDERALLGVPIAIKDESDVAGEVNTHGTDAFTEPAPADCEMVRRLREAGAIVVGLTLLPELAICGFTESATYGVTRNPWDPQRSPAGSSGGSAAAVAAGLVPIASAGDGGGSIRLPAASCGLFGLKPTRGRVSLAPALELWNGLAVNGCVSRTVLDTALWLDVVAGGSKEPGAPPPPERPFVESAKAAPGKLRIAHSTLAPRAAAPPKISNVVKEAVADTADLLRSLGHEVAQRDPDWGGIGNNITPRFLRGVAETVDEVPHPERLERRTRGFGRLGKLIPDSIFERALRGREADAARVNAIFDSFDVLMTPVMGGTAIPVRTWEGQGALRTVLGMSRFYPYCVPWNHLGNPAMAVPAGLAADGMPLSVQIVGRPGDEATLLSLAAQLEAERPWADKRPPLS